MSLSEAELNLIITPLNNDLCGTLTFHLSSVRVGKVKSQPMWLASHSCHAKSAGHSMPMLPASGPQLNHHALSNHK